MHHFYLGLAILLNLIEPSFINLFDSYIKLLHTTIFMAAYIICFYFLSLVSRTIQLGSTYALSSGISVVIKTLISPFTFKRFINIYPLMIVIALIVNSVMVMLLFFDMTIH